MRIPSIRGFFRGLSRLIANRRALKQMFHMATLDELDVSSVRAARRLVARGHGKSASTGLPVGPSGEPLAWYTYPMLDFLEGLDTKDWIVLEFGSGQSTRYWSARAKQVFGLENNASWLGKLKAGMPHNVKLELATTVEEVDRFLASFEQDPQLVVLDGIQRQACAEKCLAKFGMDPIYILDNSDWFTSTSQVFREAGLTEIRFCGFGPINNYAWCSSMWVTEENLRFLRHTRDTGTIPCGLAAGNTEKIYDQPW